MLWRWLHSNGRCISSIISSFDCFIVIPQQQIKWHVARKSQAPCHSDCVLLVVTKFYSLSYCHRYVFCMTAFCRRFFLQLHSHWICSLSFRLKMEYYCFALYIFYFSFALFRSSYVFAQCRFVGAFFFSLQFSCKLQFSARSLSLTLSLSIRSFHLLLFSRFLLYALVFISWLRFHVTHYSLYVYIILREKKKKSKT